MSNMAGGPNRSDKSHQIKPLRHSDCARPALTGDKCMSFYLFLWTEDGCAEQSSWSRLCRGGMRF